MLSFKQFIAEGNPLARVQKFGKTKRHFAVMSAERSHLSPEENKKRNERLKQDLASRKMGYKKVEGQWKGGSEKSLLIPARKKGTKAGRLLKKTVKRLGKKYDQESVLHHDSKQARLHGTTKGGYPGKGKSSKVGRVTYNKKEADFQTEMRPGKKKSSARFTTTFEK